ncbi:DUF4365 domain-containing protein [Tautonia marina]|uniref:DUF4365 domain-containing protein n=1 Tax=Tautonia marina TaxID=2653855 RepID=UPI0012612ED4|nr:DUF4365 domain-containing protein [Tautonia marina]
MLLTENDIKSELSYAYLHAVASRAGCEVQKAERYSDGAGVDATIRARERFAPDSVFTHFSIDVQLKATSGEPNLDDRGCYPFPLRLDHYNKLRDTDRQAQQFLVVLYLPPDPEQWLVHSAERMIAQRCAYWVSLQAAPDSPNKSSQTVYLPSSNLFSVAGLRSVLTRVSRGERIDYEQPV